MKHKIILIILFCVFAVFIATNLAVAPTFQTKIFQTKNSETKNPDSRDYFFTKKPEPLSEIKILFIGDIMMDRSIRTRAENLTRTMGEKTGYDFFFQCAQPVFEKYDFVVANLEGPVTNYPSASQFAPIGHPDNTKFTMSPATLLAMRNSGINIINIDNNHMYDFGNDGLRQTVQNIISVDIKYFGDPFNPDQKSINIVKNGISFDLISYNEFFGKTEETISEIETINSKKFSEGNLNRKIIIFAHWGDEYVEVPERIRKTARNFINSGTDIIIGTHPHVLQEVEIYNQKPIFYSLGNFIFDQYWDDFVKNGGVAEIVINNRGEVTSRLFHVYLDTERRRCISD